MKTFRIALSLLLIISSQAGFSQSGSWDKAGNSLTGTEKLGSINTKPLRFFTKNQQRMTLDTGGRLGIGITDPRSRLHVVNGSAGIPFSPDSTVSAVIESSRDNFLTLYSPSNRATGIIFNNSSFINGSIAYNTATTSRGFEFKNGSFIRMKISDFGLVGIGISQPKANLHVAKGGGMGLTPHQSAGIVMESVTTNFINLLNPDHDASGVLFGNNLNNSDGGLIYSGEGTPRGLQFNTGGNATRMVLTSSGRIGLGTKSPTANLHIVHGIALDGSDGLKIENSQSGKNWTLHTFETNGNFEFYANGKFKAFIDAPSGTYVSMSDARAKKNIEQAPDVLEKLMQLQVKRYHFLDNKPSDKKYYGMIAQDVEKLFPDIVYHKTAGAEDRYMVNQSAYGVIAIKAIQELKAEIEELKMIIKEMEAKKEQPSLFNASSDKLTTGEKRTALTSGKLFQNAPNPFNSQTTIRYYIPQLKGKATIAILSSGGQLIKTYPVTGSGQGQLSINAGELAAGTYQYVLSMDGVQVDARQMVVIK